MTLLGPLGSALIGIALAAFFIIGLGFVALVLFFNITRNEVFDRVD